MYALVESNEITEIFSHPKPLTIGFVAGTYYDANVLYEEGDVLPEGKSVGDVKHAVGDLKTPRQGVNYPQNIFNMWSEAELKAIGVYTAVIDTTNLSSASYYVNTGITYTYNSGTDTVTGTYGTATAQSLTDVLFTAADAAAGRGTEGDVKSVGLKNEEITRTNNHATSLLDKYDWYTLRAASGGTAIPSAVATYQAAVRTKANEHEAAINAVSTLSALAALEADWPTEPS